MTTRALTFLGAAVVLLMCAVVAVVIVRRRGDPPPRMIPGQSLETRPPELVHDAPAFPGQTRAPYKPGVGVDVAVLTDALDLPWSLAFLPSGRMLVTEKPGTLRFIDPSRVASDVPSAPVAGVPAVVFTDQTGLLDVALDPAFAANHRLFLSYNEAVGDAESRIVIARAILDEAAATLRDVRVIFRSEPALPRSRSANAGGRLVIGRDGNLFATIGDRSESPPWDMAQRLDNDLGKIIRITPDGGPAPGNPFASTPGARPEIWSLGHRSEEGLAIDGDGQLWETEHGPRGGDELNRIVAGRNYGWPVVVHGIDYPGTTIGQGLVEKPGMEQPVYYWDPVLAPSGLAIYDGALFRGWQGNMLIGGLRARRLARLTLDAGRVVSEDALLVDARQRIRDVRVGPDGAVYVLTDGEHARLLKLTPEK